MRKRTTNGSTEATRTDAGGSSEPIGIVISRGATHEDSPRFAAYVWGPVPEAELNDALVAVA